MANLISVSTLHFIINIGVCDQVWMHGLCARILFCYLQQFGSSFMLDASNPTISAKNDVVIIRIEDLIKLHLPTIPSNPATPRQQLNSVLIFLRTILPTFSLPLYIFSSVPCFICGMSEGFMVKCTASNCTAYCHPLCYKYGVRVPEIIGLVLKQGIKCPLHREMNIRSMKCPRSRCSSVPSSSSSAPSSTPSPPGRP